MGRPYKRIVVLHVAVLIGAVPIMMAGSPAPLLVILIVMKIGLDAVLHVRSHRTALAEKRAAEALSAGGAKSNNAVRGHQGRRRRMGTRSR
jgi:hypothetical protein